MYDAVAYCGCGSTFSIENYELSNPIHDDKIRNTIPRLRHSDR